MHDIIKNDYMGATITVGITGVPVVITGEVIASYNSKTIGLRLNGGNKIEIAADLIAFFY